MGLSFLRWACWLALVACIYYTVAVFLPPPLSLSMEMKTQSPGRWCCGAACLGFLRWSSVAPSVGPVFVSSVVVCSCLVVVCGVIIIIGSSLVAACLPLPIASVCGVSGSAAGFSLRPLRGRDACRIARRVGCRSVFSSPVVLFVLACLAIPYRPPPRPIDKPDGAGVLRHPGGGGVFSSASRRRGLFAFARLVASGGVPMMCVCGWLVVSVLVLSSLVFALFRPHCPLPFFFFFSPAPSPRLFCGLPA